MKNVVNLTTIVGYCKIENGPYSLIIAILVSSFNKRSIDFKLKNIFPSKHVPEYSYS